MNRITLVEDTAHLAEEIADILVLEGYAVTTLGNAEEALLELPAIRPDLIITDLRMPHMDGFEFIGCIKALPEFDAIPIVILSAKSSPEDRQRGMEVGANEFILKPCKSHELVAAIRALLKQ